MDYWIMAGAFTAMLLPLVRAEIVSGRREWAIRQRLADIRQPGLTLRPEGL